MERYHIDVPPPLRGTSSRQAFRAENMMLRDIIRQAGIALEEDYAQMKLMDLENERLRKRIEEKGKRKYQSKLTSGRARHMTAAENLDLLARQDWESGMKDVFKEAAPQFRVLKKNILDYQKEIEKAKKVAEQEARKAATAAAWARGRGTGNRGGRRGRGVTPARGRGRGAPVAGGAGATADDLDSGSEPLGMTESSRSSSDSDSDSDSESEAEVPIPRSCRQRPIRVIQGRHEGVGEVEGNERVQPRPRPRMRNHPPESQDAGEDREVEAPESGGVDAIGGDGPGTLRDEGGQGHVLGPEVGINLVPTVVEGGLETRNRDIEVPAMVQSGEIETEVGPARRRNPRCR
jgi:hypothetical protein